MVEVQRLDRVVRPDAVTRCLGAETGAFTGFVGVVTTVTIRSFNECVVLSFRNDVEGFGHG